MLSSDVSTWIWVGIMVCCESVWLRSWVGLGCEYVVEKLDRVRI